jgi:hypothetical protein
MDGEPGFLFIPLSIFPQEKTRKELTLVRIPNKEHGRNKLWKRRAFQAQIGVDLGGQTQGLPLRIYQRTEGIHLHQLDLVERVFID